MADLIPSLDAVNARLMQRLVDLDYLKRLAKADSIAYSESPPPDDVARFTFDPGDLMDATIRVEAEIKRLRRQKRLSAELAELSEAETKPAPIADAPPPAETKAAPAETKTPHKPAKP